MAGGRMLTDCAWRRLLANRVAGKYLFLSLSYHLHTRCDLQTINKMMRGLRKGKKGGKNQVRAFSWLASDPRFLVLDEIRLCWGCWSINSVSERYEMTSADDDELSFSSVGSPEPRSPNGCSCDIWEPIVSTTWGMCVYDIEGMSDLSKIQLPRFPSFVRLWWSAFS